MQHGDTVHLLFTGDLIHGPHLEEDEWPDFLGEYYRDASGEVMEAFVDLAYQSLDVLHNGRSYPEIRLSSITHSYSDGATPCAKYEVRFNYSDAGFPGFHALATESGHVLATSAFVTSIESRSATDASCASGSQLTLRTYKLTYSADQDTGLPRLTSVDQWGQGENPASGAGISRAPCSRAFTRGSTTAFRCCCCRSARSCSRISRSSGDYAEGSFSRRSRGWWSACS